MENRIDTINRSLEAPLNSARISTRDKQGIKLSYIQSWDAIDTANRIFGFLNWGRETVYCKEVCRYEYNNKSKVGYEAMVAITVTIEGVTVTRHGTGAGSQVATDLFDAIEGAAKEAESDAMKRALSTFGNQFGLCLYDKKQAGVSNFDRPKAEGWYANVLRTLEGLDADSRTDWLADNYGAMEKMRINAPDIHEDIMNKINEEVA